MLWLGEELYFGLFGLQVGPRGGLGWGVVEVLSLSWVLGREVGWGGDEGGEDEAGDEEQDLPRTMPLLLSQEGARTLLLLLPPTLPSLL